MPPDIQDGKRQDMSVAEFPEKTHVSRDARGEDPFPVATCHLVGPQTRMKGVMLELSQRAIYPHL